MRRYRKVSHLPLTETLRSKILSWSKNSDHVLWLDSNRKEGEKAVRYGEFEAVLALGAQDKIKSDDSSSFDKLSTWLKNKEDYCFGYFSYDLKNEIEDLCSENPDGLEFPEMFFFQPRKILYWKDGHLHQLYSVDCKEEMESDLHAIQVAESKSPSLRVPNIRARIEREEYLKKVDRVLEHIHRGDIYEVNFCQEFYAENCRIDAETVFLRLNKISEAPFASFLKFDERYLLCSSPERFIKKEGESILSQPIKGTARRSNEPDTDKSLARSLEKNPKERAENIMIVDLVRNDLSKNARKGSVQVEELCKVYSFKQVHQMISTISAEIDDDVDPVEIIKNLFPMGSMTGAPKISAMQIIEEEEESKRGLFSGAVGYFTPEKDFDFNVVIRSILYNAVQSYVSITVGSAITSRSVPSEEFEECLIKADAMIRVLKQ